MRINGQRRSKSIGETITKPKKIKLALEDRPRDQFFRVCEKFKTIKDDLSLEDWKVLYKPMAVSLSNMLSIMENHEASWDDIKDVAIDLMESKENIKISFKRYRNGKLQPMQIIVTEFKKGVGLINPSIMS